MPNYRTTTITTITTTCALLLLAATTACTENPPGSTITPPPTTPTATPTSSPTPQPPAMPPAAKAKSKAGLQAFARHWLELESYAHATGNSSPYLALSRPTCEWCLGIAGVYRNVYAAGGRYEGDLSLELRDFGLLHVNAAEGTGAAGFRVYLPRALKIAKAGAQPQGQKSALVDYSINVTYVQGAWRVDTASTTVLKEGI
ncbi:DUF6318 family protein [Kribbella sp. NBC_01245]|uniref:DUF6318 family protein n=1 Tax=Kribbella sp. NBC_01245 TaxID=2903578 RepID=UPI002E2E6893|nr:DUF6318 family protein [Kribbella sp. NBC_01245]